MNKASLIIVCVYVEDYRIDRKFHVGRIVNAMIDVTMWSSCSRRSNVIATKLNYPLQNHYVNFAAFGNDNLDLMKHSGLLSMLPIYIIVFYLL